MSGFITRVTLLSVSCYCTAGWRSAHLFMHLSSLFIRETMAFFIINIHFHFPAFSKTLNESEKDCIWSFP